MVDILGTLGPGCSDEKVLREMFKEGMTGVRLNLSHTMLSDNEMLINTVKAVAREEGTETVILIDLQGPELRIGNLKSDLMLENGDKVSIFISSEHCTDDISVDERIFNALEVKDEILLDDGKIQGRIITKQSDYAELEVLRGGNLKSRKSILIKNKTVDMPTLTDADIINIKEASKAGVTGIMQPFVRNRQDIITLRNELEKTGGSHIKIYAKIENMSGVNMMDELIAECDEIVIARGDLGNAVPLYELPAVQKKIASKCREQGRRFMVVTQMLSSMEKNPVPTRAEVSDIFNAVLDGASSVMVTGETATGLYPIEVIRYLSRTSASAEAFIG